MTFNKLQYKQLQEIRKACPIADVEHAYGKLVFLTNKISDLITEAIRAGEFNGDELIELMVGIAATSQHCVEELLPVEPQIEEIKEEIKEDIKFRNKLVEIFNRISSECEKTSAIQEGESRLRFDFESEFLSELDEFLVENEK